MVRLRLKNILYFKFMKKYRERVFVLVVVRSIFYVEDESSRGGIEGRALNYGKESVAGCSWLTFVCMV